ncbi:MAG: hypothetical protein LC799_15880, partial [Actinobacteria bacterium]|nr:hypothetical protein [Actinomycetota bacterium]
SHVEVPPLDPVNAFGLDPWEPSPGLVTSLRVLCTADPGADHLIDLTTGASQSSSVGWLNVQS